jgi:predicted deacetylase
LLDQFEVKPIVSVVPDNKDPQLIVDPPDPHFWDLVQTWKERGWEIALHGYQHLYETEIPGIVPLNRFSEFAGVELERQTNKIESGINIFRKRGITPRVWVAPGHSFDQNTLTALRNSSNIRVVSDGFDLFPYMYDNFYFIPQQLWRIRKVPIGTWTVCLHPNTMSPDSFEHLSRSLPAIARRITNLDEVLDSFRPRHQSRLFNLSLRAAFQLKRWIRR